MTMQTHPLEPSQHKKIETYAIGNKAMTLPATLDTHPHYYTKVYVNNFMSLAIGYSAKHLRHMMRATIMGIYNVFPAETLGENNSISLMKLLKGDAEYATTKCLLGF
jgi:hypothetical protein